MGGKEVYVSAIHIHGHLRHGSTGAQKASIYRYGGISRKDQIAFVGTYVLRNEMREPRVTSLLRQQSYDCRYCIHRHFTKTNKIGIVRSDPRCCAVVTSDRIGSLTELCVPTHDSQWNSSKGSERRGFSFTSRCVS